MNTLTKIILWMAVVFLALDYAIDPYAVGFKNGYDKGYEKGDRHMNYVLCKEIFGSNPFSSTTMTFEANSLVKIIKCL